MNRITTAVLTTLISLPCLVITAFADSDIDQHRDCKHCGMDRKAYGYSRMLVDYKDGKQVATCSLHCVVTELKKKSGEVVTYKVADRTTRKLIDATTSFWVIGGSKRGVMTARAKWAFTAKESAESFINTYGGTLATWDEALTAAREDAAPKPKR